MADNLIRVYDNVIDEVMQKIDTFTKEKFCYG
jgi:hypothetical protein